METKDRIIEAMTALFATKGYAASMADISKMVGIKVPSIYSHFKGKDQILYLAIEKELSDQYSYLVKLKEKFKEHSTEDKLKGIYFGVLTYFEDPKKLKFIRYIDLIPDKELYERCNALQSKNMAGIVKALEEIFKEGHESKAIKNTPNEDYHLLYITLIEGILTGMLTYRSKTEQRKIYETKVWNTFWNSIKA